MSTYDMGFTPSTPQLDQALADLKAGRICQADYDHIASRADQQAEGTPDDPAIRRRFVADMVAAEADDMRTRAGRVTDELDRLFWHTLADHTDQLARDLRQQ